jgi:hypothetical protein
MTNINGTPIKVPACDICGASPAANYKCMAIHCYLVFFRVIETPDRTLCPEHMAAVWRHAWFESFVPKSAAPLNALLLWLFPLASWLRLQRKINSLQALKPDRHAQSAAEEVREAA